MNTATPRFIEHPSVSANPSAYGNATLDIEKALPSWKQSLIAYKWLDSEGQPKKPEALADEQRAQRDDILRILAKGDALPTPIIGLGMFDNVEVGSGAGVIATLADMGIKLVPVHLRRAQEKGLKKFLV